MQIPAIPDNEAERLLELEELQLSYFEKNPNFDAITRLAATICEVPIALISLVDSEKQRFKSKVGTEMCETDREISFCAHAILNPRELTIIEDAREDIRFKDNPLTNQESPVIFYAGIPLLTSKGNPLGTLCIIDSKPKTLTQSQIDSLKDLASQVESLFELRRNNLKLLEAEKLLHKKNEQLRKFAGTVSHDMKMPLANMIVTTDILRAKYALKLDEQGNNYLSYLKQSSFSLSDYIDNLLSYYESEELVIQQAEVFDLHDLLEEIIDLLNINQDFIINLPDEGIELNTNKSALNQILLNLITNSLKYNDKKTGIITLKCVQDHAYYYIEVADNGKGIPKEKQESIFELFSTATDTDNKGKKGNGIGLSTVRNLVHSLGGIISVSSKEGEGATFDFTIKKVKA